MHNLPLLYYEYLKGTVFFCNEKCLLNMLFVSNQRASFIGNHINKVEVILKKP